MAAFPRFNIDAPLWDQSSFLGRLKHFFWVTDPRSCIVSEETLDSAKQLVEQYRWSLNIIYLQQLQIEGGVMLYMTWYMHGLVMFRVCVNTFFCILGYDLDRSYSSRVFSFIVALKSDLAWEWSAQNTHLLHTVAYVFRILSYIQTVFH